MSKFTKKDARLLVEARELSKKLPDHAQQTLNNTQVESKYVNEFKQLKDNFTEYSLFEDSMLFII